MAFFGCNWFNKRDIRIEEKYDSIWISSGVQCVQFMWIFQTFHGVLDHNNTVWDISVTISSFYKAYAEINSGMHDRLSKNWFQKKNSNKNMFQGRKG